MKKCFLVFVAFAWFSPSAFSGPSYHTKRVSKEASCPGRPENEYLIDASGQEVDSLELAKYRVCVYANDDAEL